MHLRTWIIFAFFFSFYKRQGVFPPEQSYFGQSMRSNCYFSLLKRLCHITWRRFLHDGAATYTSPRLRVLQMADWELLLKKHRWSCPINYIKMSFTYRYPKNTVIHPVLQGQLFYILLFARFNELNADEWKQMRCAGDRLIKSCHEIRKKQRQKSQTAEETLDAEKILKKARWLERSDRVQNTETTVCLWWSSQHGATEVERGTTTKDRSWDSRKIIECAST